MENLACTAPDYFELGGKLFAGECALIWAAAGVGAQLPKPTVPEIAFAGRSNVGKSSLLNALTGRKALARSSRTPGRTRALHFYALGKYAEGAGLCLVDMPGYGYAAASKELAASWMGLSQDYLHGRTALLRVMLLIDGRHGPKPADAGTMTFLDRAAISYQIVLTKKDEVSAFEAETNLAAAHELIAGHSAAIPRVIFTSAHSGEGIGDLRAAIAQLLYERGERGRSGQG
jgi:GTP-binding protein